MIPPETGIHHLRQVLQAFVRPVAETEQGLVFSPSDIAAIVVRIKAALRELENTPAVADALAVEWLARLVEEIGWGADATEGHTYYVEACALHGLAPRELTIAEPSDDAPDMAHIRAALRDEVRTSEYVVDVVQGARMDGASLGGQEPEDG